MGVLFGPPPPPKRAKGPCSVSPSVRQPVIYLPPLDFFDFFASSLPIINYIKWRSPIFEKNDIWPKNGQKLSQLGPKWGFWQFLYCERQQWCIIAHTVSYCAQSQLGAAKEILANEPEICCLILKLILTIFWDNQLFLKKKANLRLGSG